MKVTLFLPLPSRWEAREHHHRRRAGENIQKHYFVGSKFTETCNRCFHKRNDPVHVQRRAKETLTRRSSYRPYRRVVGSGGVRGFSKLLPRIPRDAKKEVCSALSDTEDAMWDALARSVRTRDLYSLDKEVEEQKWTSGALRSCRLR